MVNNQSVRRHLDAFTRGRNIGKLDEGRSVTSVAAEFGIAHSIVSRLWRQFQTTGTAIRGFSSGRPRGTTPADDRYIVLQARRNRRQTAGEISRHTTQATGRPISLFIVARRLHGGDESRFSLSSDSHRILIWRERGSRNHPSNIIERDRYGGRGVLVWGGIMLGSRTDLHIFDAGSVNGTRYCNEILLPYVRLFRGTMGLQFLFMDDNAPCHRTVTAEQLLESRRLAARTLPPVTIRELRLALQDEWAAMPQQLIDTFILSMGRRCETCLARFETKGDHVEGWKGFDKNHEKDRGGFGKCGRSIGQGWKGSHQTVESIQRRPVQLHEGFGRRNVELRGFNRVPSFPKEGMYRSKDVVQMERGKLKGAKHETGKRRSKQAKRETNKL
ncbi:transposable element Tc1 transposase [Trichonephila clavipes]|nr:transposable element Tc1 transposase [Trichonephila clavipes]